MNYLAVVLSYNQPHLARRMWEQLGNQMVLIDCASADVPKVDCEVIRLKENRLFAANWNAAMAHLYDRADYIWMLNSDVEGVSIPMLRRLVGHAVEGGYGAVTPAFNSPHAIFHSRGRGVREVRWLDWCAPVVSTAMWKHVGPFDADLFPGYGADIDFSHRARQIGYRFAVCDNQIIHHLGSQTALAEGLQGAQGDVGGMNAGLSRKWGVKDWSELT